MIICILQRRKAVIIAENIERARELGGIGITDDDWNAAKVFITIDATEEEIVWM